MRTRTIAIASWGQEWDKMIKGERTLSYRIEFNGELIWIPKSEINVINEEVLVPEWLYIRMEQEAKDSAKRNKPSKLEVRLISMEKRIEELEKEISRLKSMENNLL